MPHLLSMSLPDLIISALLLTTLFTDITKHRIPNTLVLAILITGLIIQFAVSGWSGITHSLFGLITGFLMFMPFHLLGGMRGGDLKLMAAIGAYLTFNTPVAAGLSLVSGAVFGTIVLLWRGGGYDYYLRYSTMLMEGSGYGHWKYRAPEPGEAAATSFPYATAITTGTFLTMMYFR